MTEKIEAAKAAKATVETDLLKIPGVNAVDVGYKYVNGKRTDEISVRVHVTKKKQNVDPAEMIPGVVNGIKTDVIEGVYEPYLVTKQLVAVATPQPDTTVYRPLQGGASIGPDRSVGGYIFAGTLGCMVKDVATGNVMMLSNFHVMCVDNTWHVGDSIDQPSLIDTGTSADGVGTINRAVLSSQVDGAVASINAGINGINTIAGIGNVAGTAVATLGMAVRKKGRTTLLTYGTVEGLDASVVIDYGAGIGQRTLQGQITIAPDTTKNPVFSDHGDSGSAIVDDDNNVVGLLFAGSPSNTLANPISAVESELNIQVSA